MNFEFFIERNRFYIKNVKPVLVAEDDEARFFFENPPENAVFCFSCANGGRYFRRLEEDNSCAIKASLLGDKKGCLSISMTGDPTPSKEIKTNILEYEKTDSGYIVFPSVEKAVDDLLVFAHDATKEINGLHADIESLETKLRKYMEGYEIV